MLFMAGCVKNADGMAAQICADKDVGFSANKAMKNR